ncbi:Verlamelin biosynthesis protein B, partial [Lachnellula cervina]
PLPSPLAHFHSIPWCHALLTHRSILHTAIPDRTPIASTESSLVRETLNTSRTVKACVTFLRHVKPAGAGTGSKKAAIEREMQARGEGKENPFLEYGALVDLGEGVNGYAGTAHGGFFGVVLDEVMGTAANAQAKHGALTAALTVRFKKPLYTPSVVVVGGRVVEKKGRKLSVKGSFADSEGNVLAEADGVWVMVDRDVGRWTDAK